MIIIDLEEFLNIWMKMKGERNRSDVFMEVELSYVEESYKIGRVYTMGIIFWIFYLDKSRVFYLFF